MQSDFAIEIGTSNTRIFTVGKGITVNEPSAAVFDNAEGEITEVGKKAFEMLGRVSGRYSVVCPIREGVIADYGIACTMVGKFLKKVMRSSIVMPKAVLCVPSEITEVEKRALLNLLETFGTHRISVIKQPVAAAMGAGTDINSPHGAFVVNIGGGMADMAVISLGGTAVTGTVRSAGNAMDEEIISYIRRTYNMNIGKRTAENAKINAGSVIEGTVSGTYTIKGKCMITGMPIKVDIDAEELVKPLQKTANLIVSKIQDMLENTPPELIGDIHKDGIILTGGTAHLRGIDRFIENAVSLKVRVADEPELCTIKGSGAATAYLNDKKSKINPLR